VFYSACWSAGDAGGDTLRAILYAGGCGGWSLFAGGVGGGGGDAMCATLLDGGVGRAPR